MGGCRIVGWVGVAAAAAALACSGGARGAGQASVTPASQTPTPAPTPAPAPGADTGTGTAATPPSPPPPPPATPPPVVLQAPLSMDGWTFYGAEQGLPAEPYDVSADEAGNVYVAGGDAVYAKPPASAASAPAGDVFHRFDAAAAGLTQNCFAGLDPWTATQADLYRVAHPDPPGAPAMCPVISVAGAAPGKAIVGFDGYGTDGDLDAEWAKDSGGLDVLAYDAAAEKLSRTRHVHIASPPGVICGTHENGGDPSAPCEPWDEFIAYGRRKLHKTYRVVVNHHQGTPQYGDVWMGGTHATFAGFFNERAEARGWYGNAWIRSCPSGPNGTGDASVCPKFQDPTTGSWNVFEHEHPSFIGASLPNEPGVPIGPNLTGETWAMAIAPSGQPWAHNGLRLAAMHGDTADLSGVYMDFTKIFDLWPDTPTAPDDDDVRAMTFCPDGALWVGSTTHGLARVDTTTGAVAGRALPGGGQNVWALACDRNGNLWISTDWAEIVRLDTRTGAASLAPAALPELARHVAYSIQIDDWSGPNPIVYFAMRSLAGAPGGVVAYGGP